ncbi:MAG: alpha-amylase family glycosyl hydrolase [Propionicimonas sp.]
MTARPTDLASRLGEAVLYQIYPQSFADGNDDGVGDLNGIRQRLDYLAWLGVNVLWLNPCFVSPFDDAGYDIADYLTIAPRYGTNTDLAALCAEAADRGIAIVLDLVAGHTSDRHPWFAAACRPDADPAVRDRYIWSNVQRVGWHRPRGAHEPGPYYLPNFFPIQPALNFGYARMNPDEPWRQGVDAPGPQANRAALREIMAHWFDLGVSGFRVDMAASLVKDDPGLVETGRLWREMRTWLETAHPGRILVAEWGDPAVSVPTGFHADFFLHFGRDDYGLAWRSLFNNNAGTVDPVWQQDACWADASGRGDAATFVKAWEQAASAIGSSGQAYGRPGVVGLPTANHDVTRMVAGPRDATQVAVAMTLVLTWPALPSIYYGDEIGMRYLPDAPSIEGSRLGATYDRAGSRTPMQWGNLDATYGPGTPAQSRYLEPDSASDAPTVADALTDPGSLLHLTRELIALRRTDPRLHASAPVGTLMTGYPLAYTRGADASLLVVLNPSGNAVTLTVPDRRHGTIRIGRNAHISGREVCLAGFGLAILDLTERAQRGD